MSIVYTSMQKICIGYHYRTNVVLYELESYIRREFGEAFAKKTVQGNIPFPPKPRGPPWFFSKFLKFAL